MNKYIDKKITEIYHEIDKVGKRIDVYSDIINKKIFNVYTLINNFQHGPMTLHPNSKDYLLNYNKVKEAYKLLIIKLTKLKCANGLLFTLFIDIGNVYLIIKQEDAKQYTKELLDIIRSSVKENILKVIIDKLDNKSNETQTT